jgi:hypothetical protein
LELLRKAAKQTARRNKIFEEQHKEVLSSDWTYVRAVALPMVESLPGEICDKCRRFVLCQNQLSSLKELQDWLDQVKNIAPSADLNDVDHEYRNLLTRIIGFLLISPKEIAPEKRELYNRTHNERQQGLEKEHDEVLTGPTPNPVDNPTKEDQDCWGKGEKTTKSHLGSLQARFMLLF